MVGSALHRHDNVHRQLATFAELLRRVQSHYATDQLHQMLCAVCLGVPDDPRGPRARRAAPSQQRNQWTTHGAPRGTGDVTSLSQLRSLVSGLRSGGPRRGGIHRKDHRSIVSYFDRFFDDLDRLRDIKRNFHERVYACLYEHYYQPDSEHAFSPTSTSFPDGGGGGRPLATVLDQSDNDAPSPLDDRPLSEIVQQMWTLNRDWDRVLSKEDHDTVETDHEPRTEEERFGRITSIVPNWVEFGFRALQLAKVWWTTANRIYGRSSEHNADETRARNGSETFRLPYPGENEEDDDVVSVKEDVATLSDCACQISVELESLREELRRVRNHGERVEALYKKLNSEDRLADWT